MPNLMRPTDLRVFLFNYRYLLLDAIWDCCVCWVYNVYWVYYLDALVFFVIPVYLVSFKINLFYVGSSTFGSKKL